MNRRLPGEPSPGKSLPGEPLTGGLAPDAAAAVADALRTLRDELADWSRAGALPAAPSVDAAFEDIVFATGIGLGGDSSDAVFGSLGVEAAIDTNAAVSQRSLREFLS